MGAGFCSMIAHKTLAVRVFMAMAVTRTAPGNMAWRISMVRCKHVLIDNGLKAGHGAVGTIKRTIPRFTYHTSSSALHIWSEYEIRSVFKP
ncbi:protein of unknown function [Georgfuchsia toluolica]|uniref:Uncharacterized protein n=1 Tax=Georgfuchsia toluolica TaxID=424218 RepID=A0A916N8S7_9PROT|nr:protein of unknown function [Georgfuchsia toluolica]